SKDVPEDADTLVIAGPGTPLTAKELDALERYMDRGGRMVVFLDIFLDRKETELKTTGIEDFLRKYGVLVGTNFPIRVPQQGAPSRAPRDIYALAPADSTNELVKQFQDAPFMMRTARIVRPDVSSKKYKAEVALQLDRRLRQFYLDETNVKALTS